jgi:hypothetical protein
VTKHIWPESEKSLATSDILLIFSALSSAVKPRSLLRPLLITSPSKIKHLRESPSILSNSALTAVDKVLLPEPDSPVNQKVAPLLIE